MDAQTTTQVAAVIGCSSSAIRKFCERHVIGQVIGGVRLLVPADVERLRGLVQDGPGRPRKAT